MRRWIVPFTLVIALLAASCDQESLCGQGATTLTLSDDSGALWLWDGDQAGIDDITVNRAGDGTCGVRVDLQTDSGESVRGVDASYDPEAGTLSIDLDPGQLAAGLNEVDVVLQGDDELARYALTVRHLPEPATDAAPHVVVFGVDGLRPDAIAASETPTLDMLSAHGALALDSSTQLTGDTSSGPGWASILTGVEVTRHGVVSNDLAVMSNIDRTVPSFFDIAFTEGLNTRMLVHWVPLQLLLDPAAAMGFRFGTDSQVARFASAALEDPVDVLFLHFDACDGAGHGTGFGPSNPDYIDAVEGVDQHITTVMEAIVARETYADEAWLFVVVTDHGGEGTSHGARDAINRTIPMVVSRPGLGAVTLPTGTSHMDVAPTVLSHLGIDHSFQHDGRVLTEALR